ncbi:MAG: lipid A deacylase LpxR family protein [Nevskiaceae bacterium]
MLPGFRWIVLSLAALALALPPRAAGQERDNAGWALFMDNDALTAATGDHDYTGGIALTLAGARVQRGPFSLDPALGWLDRELGLAPRDATEWHALQLSMLTFTPRTLDRADVIPGDRPYASIVYLANSRTTVLPDAPVAYQSSLAIGVLGLDAAKASQRALHGALGADRPQGWDHQIAEGGEPTARYTLARLGLRAADGANGRRFELKDAVAVSAGYLTEASVALTLRWGRIHTPWWSFVPERAEYMMEPAPVFGGASPDGPRELYAWAGIKGRARLYNAFLQGQFRDSDLTYDFGDTRPLIGELWAGVTAELAAGYRLSYVLRYQTSELRTEPGDRDLFWGGLSVSRSF